MRGRPIRLSKLRRFVTDLMHFSADVPGIPVQRRMLLGPLCEARAALKARPSWTAIFTKAYDLVARECDELRRAYVKLPWPRLYQYPGSIASITIEREHQGEHGVFITKIKNPAKRSLAELDRRLRHAMTAPVESISHYRRLLRIAAMPRPLRRLLWWIGLNVGRLRPTYFGTFGVSVYSGLGAESLHPRSPLATVLNYGVIAKDGTVDVRIVYDHRVLDGATVARALARLEEVLCGALAAELRASAAPAGDSLRAA